MLKHPLLYVWVVLIAAFVGAGLLGPDGLMALGRGPGNVATALQGKPTQPKQQHADQDQLPSTAAEENQKGAAKEAECSNPNQSYYDCVIQLRTARATERQAKVAKNTERVAWFALLFAAVAAAAAWWTVKVMRDTAKRELRAYVYVDEAKIVDFDNDKKATVRLKLKNSGRTPAYDLAQVAARVTRPLGDQSPFPTIDGPTEDGSNTIVNPDGIFVVPVKFDYDPLQMVAIRNGAVNFYVFGTIWYKDAFDRPQQATFRMIYHVGGGDELGFCAEGNKAT
jgi:hypothetical protein